ncbi:hypothetical protein C8Q76DRAFT_310575 [Earliella scabrosa]|nr:hypothetical protein C8Q76DRAFT_310575 [Earliella scabrosa]
MPSVLRLATICCTMGVARGHKPCHSLVHRALASTSGLVPDGFLKRHRVHGNGMRMRSRLALFLVPVGADSIGCAPAIWHVSVAQASPVGPEQIVGGFHRRVGRAARDFTVGWQESLPLELTDVTTGAV